MSTKWTEEQKESIFEEGSNLLVAAGAGAGKTAVLVQRIIRKITDEDLDIDIDKLLVVTYTNAAASEMKERIGDELQKNLEEKIESRRLQRQLTLLNQANIMTMHSFCLKVIRDNFHMVDLDPNFRVSDNQENILLKQDAVQELFEEKYDKEDNDFLNLIDSYGDKNDSTVQNIVLSLYDFVQSIPWPKKWLAGAAESFNLGEDFKFETSKWAKIIILSIKIEIKALKDNLEKAVGLIYAGSGIEAYKTAFYDDISKFDDLLKLDDWNKVRDEILNFKFQKLTSVKNDQCDNNIKSRVTKIRKNVKDSLKSMSEKIFGYTDDVAKSIRDMYPVMKCLAKIVMDFNERYSSKKRERDIVDFNDIEHLCLDILTASDEHGKIIPSSTALYYRKIFREILIDEYQDINGVQEVIINMISRKYEDSNLFMVGDVKQSIYRFRQAKPELFLEKYKSYSDEKGKSNRRIKLFKNFRSRFNIIGGVNYLFKQIMSEEIGELNYDENEELESGASYPELTNLQIEKNIKIFNDSAIELNLIDKITEDEEEENLDNIQVEARLIANKINDLVNPKNGNTICIYDKNINGYRHLMYKDIVILMRATRNAAPDVVEELNNLHIPVFADTSIGYFETTEIKTIMSLLKIIDNPIQDIPLISVLRSPIESFSPEELIDIRLVNKDIPFYEALKICSVDSDDHLKNKVNNFLKRLNNWRHKVSYMSIDEFIWYLYIETGYYGFVGAMSGGTQRQANLRMLFEKAEQYEKSSYKGLFNFINFMNKLKSSSGDMGSAKILGENENVVRIMSIHKSKGLEFPVVILAASGKNFNFMDMNKPILFNEEFGLGPDYVDVKRRIRYPTIIKQIMKNKAKVETLSEEMRILYVAFTRAKEKLIITGMVNDIEKTCKKWCEDALVHDKKIPKYSIMNAKNYIDWIGEALARHRDGKIIRDCENEEYNSNLINDSSKWSIKFWKREDFFKTLEKEEKIDVVEEIERKYLNEDKSKYYEEINRRLDWKYKYDEISRIPAKFSVSELKRRFNLIDMEDSAHFIEKVNLKRPNFIKQKKNFSASEKGTLMHLAMQHIDIKNVESVDSIDEQIKSLVIKEFITEEESMVISPYKILKFFKSSLGKRMEKSRKISREVPFYMKVNSSDLYKNLSIKDEYILIQGIIDCYFEEDDGLVLIDYKTDYVDDIDELEHKYKIQIYYYSQALERMTGMKVKEKYLYSFYKDAALFVL